MRRTIGSAGLKLIKEFEGCRLTAYQSSAGVWTIGFGHTEGVICGMTITREQAETWLREDCQKFAKYVDDPSYVPVTAELNENQRDALISFSYNCGAGNLKKLCRNRNVEEIGDAIALYNKASGKVLAGLVRRRNAEQELYRTACGMQKEVNPYREPERVISYKKGRIMCGAEVKWIQWALLRLAEEEIVFLHSRKILRICKIVETLTNLYFFVVKWVECINLPVFCAGVGTVHAGIPITGPVI